MDAAAVVDFSERCRCSLLFFLAESVFSNGSGSTSEERETWKKCRVPASFEDSFQILIFDYYY